MKRLQHRSSFFLFYLYLARVSLVLLLHWNLFPIDRTTKLALGESIIHGGIYLLLPLFWIGVKKPSLLLLPPYIFLVQILARKMSLYLFFLYLPLWWFFPHLLRHLPFQRKYLGFRASQIRFIFSAFGLWLLLLLHMLMIVRFAGFHFSFLTLQKSLPWWIHSATLNAFAEEIFYRACLFQWLYRRTGNPVTASLLTALLYALKHIMSLGIASSLMLTLAAFFYTFAFSLLSSLLLMTSASLYPSLLLSTLFHGFLNSIQW